jgi:hypothetical protein
MAEKEIELPAVVVGGKKDKEPVTVDIPNIGIVEFPSSMSNAEIEAAIVKMTTPRSTTEELSRQLGLTARAGITGVAGLPLLAGDALNTLYNMLSKGNTAAENYVRGLVGVEQSAKPSQLPMASRSAQNLMTQIGLPEPETKQERIIQDITSAVSGVGGTAKLAQALAPKAAGTQMLTSNIPLQVVGGVGGAGAAGAGREYADAGMGGQLGLSLLGGVLAPTTVAVGVPVAARTATNIVRPFTQGGREAITGKILNQLSANPELAVARMGSYKQPVAGYTPTTAQASRDIGLISAEQGIRGLDIEGMFAKQASQANKARTVILDKMAKDKETIANVITKRDELTAPIRERAFANSIATPEQFQSGITLIAEKKINDILQTPAGKRDTVISAMQDARNMIRRASTPEELYEIRKDLRAAERGLLDRADKGGASASSFKAANSQLKEVIRAVDDTIEAAAPEYKDYLKKYSVISKEIDRMNELQGIKSKVMTTIPDPINDDLFMLSQAGFAKAVRNLPEDTNIPKGQRIALQKISKDLDDGVLGRATKPAGSDTFKNMTTANIIGGIIGKNVFGDVPQVLQKVTAPMNWIYNGTDDQIRNLLVESMLDPKLASRLMSTASVVTIEPLSKELQRKAINLGYGAAFGLTKE